MEILFCKILLIDESLFLHGDPPLISIFYFKALGTLQLFLHEDPPVSLEREK